MKKYTRVQNRFAEPAVDRNDPASASTAIGLCFPHELSDKAWRTIAYFDNTAFLYEYKGRLVVTDESLWLTEFGDGTPDSPMGGPRWYSDPCYFGDPYIALEFWLEAVADDWLDNLDCPEAFRPETPVVRWAY